jgi:hypothetical protein
LKPRLTLDFTDYQYCRDSDIDYSVGEPKPHCFGEAGAETRCATAQALNVMFNMGSFCRFTKLFVPKNQKKIMSDFVLTFSP